MMLYPKHIKKQESPDKEGVGEKVNGKGSSLYTAIIAF